MYLLRFDRVVFDWVQSHQVSLLAYAARDITSLGGNVLVPLVTLYACIASIRAGDYRTAGMLALAVTFVGLLVFVLKVSIRRACPLQPDPYQECPKTAMERGGSFPMPHLPCFPSGHTTASTFLYGAILWDNYLWIALCLPVLIGLTRVYLSAHWATDVIAGLALGHVLLQGWRWLI